VVHVTVARWNLARHCSPTTSVLEKEGAVYAAPVSVTIDPGKEDEAQKMLTDQIVPMVKASTGFVAGYWLQPQDGKGWSVVIFDTEENARAAAPPAGQRLPGAPAIVDYVQFREVIASA